MKLLIGLGLVAALLVLILLAGKFILTFISGAFNAILGVFVILALIVIVIWMFSYAKKHK